MFRCAYLCVRVCVCVCICVHYGAQHTACVVGELCAPHMCGALHMQCVCVCMCVYISPCNCRNVIQFDPSSGEVGGSGLGPQLPRNLIDKQKGKTQTVGMLCLVVFGNFLLCLVVFGNF